MVQLVSASDCGSECRGFESHLPPKYLRAGARIILALVVLFEDMQMQASALLK